MAKPRNTALIVLLVAALIGLAASAYLFVVYVTGGPIICGIAGYHGCNVVRASKWAYIGPVPRPALGILYYTFFLGLVITSLSTKKFTKEFHWAILGLAIVGALESFYLVGIQIFIIQAYCVWCLTSAAATFVMTGAALTQRK